ncbi:MAG: gamma-glutamyl-gamma-aminobutyrate hydrolase family protein [Selenomonadaceae bacterium]
MSIEREIVIFTQRVEMIASYGERRDEADQNISRLLIECGYIPVPVANSPELASEYVARLRPSGIVFTGGNDLVKYGGNAPERDDMERRLISIAIERDIPLYGFCRGMQMLLDYFGCGLVHVDGHVATRHDVSGEINRKVNSYHNFGCRDIGDAPLDVLARSSDGVIEAVRARTKRIVGTMWHPERETPFDKMDKELIRFLFG